MPYRYILVLYFNLPLFIFHSSRLILLYFFKLTFQKLVLLRTDTSVAEQDKGTVTNDPFLSKASRNSPKMRTENGLINPVVFLIFHCLQRMHRTWRCATMKKGEHKQLGHTNFVNKMHWFLFPYHDQNIPIFTSITDSLTVYGIQTAHTYCPTPWLQVEVDSIVLVGPNQGDDPQFIV